MPTPAPSSAAVPTSVNPVIVWAQQKGAAIAKVAAVAVAVTTVTEKTVTKATVN